VYGQIVSYEVDVGSQIKVTHVNDLHLFPVARGFTFIPCTRPLNLLPDRHALAARSSYSCSESGAMLARRT
jgi:hypothetical protein